MKEINFKDLHGKIDFGIITIREDEFQAVLNLFGSDFYALGKQRYVICEMQIKDKEPYWIAIARCIEQGTGEGQKVASDLISDLAPDWISVIGICGSTPDEEHSLGDVFLCSRLYDFSVEAVSENKTPSFSGQGGPMHKEVQNLLSFLPALNETLEGWNKRINMDYPPVYFSDKYLYGGDEWKSKIKSLLKQRFHNKENVKPKYVTGAVASSNKLVKDTHLMDKWKETARHIQTIEMELAGVYKAARNIEKEYPILSIRGISDIVGLKRDKRWTKFACESAASFAYALLETGVVKTPIDKSNISSPFLKLRKKRLRDNFHKSITLLDQIMIILKDKDVLFPDQLNILSNGVDKMIKELSIEFNKLSSLSTYLLGIKYDLIVSQSKIEERNNSILKILAEIVDSPSSNSKKNALKQLLEAQKIGILEVCAKIETIK